ncbi:MAG: DUF3791 domain-containing protein [Bacteroides sp.]|nr:DUF3791 domain-containing protein [Bacteroides sp.]
MKQDYPELVNDTLLQMKFARIIDLLAQRLSIPHPQALVLFYGTNVYRYMSQKLAHLHNMSDAYVADEVMLELHKQM